MPIGCIIVMKTIAGNDGTRMHAHIHTTDSIQTQHHMPQVGITMIWLRSEKDMYVLE